MMLMTNNMKMGQPRTHIVEAESRLCTILSKHVNVYCRHIDYRIDETWRPRESQTMIINLTIDDGCTVAPL